jgi:hypothetical protein
LGSAVPMSLILSQCGGEMMQPTVVSHLKHSALLSKEATTPHARANCFCDLDYMLGSIDC